MTPTTTPLRPTPPTETQGRKTPAEFIAAADVFNAELGALMKTQADAVQAVVDHMADRENLVASAKAEMAGAYARTLLRKA